MSNKQVKNTSPTRERASAPGVRASVTIEAAFAVPLFMFAVLSLIFLIEIRVYEAASMQQEVMQPNRQQSQRLSFLY